MRKESILLINRIVQAEFGGIFVPPDNLHNEGALDYVLESISGAEIFGHEIHGDVFSKASALLCTIIKQHVFLDGNKRTGLESTRLFLARNGYVLTTRPRHAEYIMEVARCTAEEEETAAWLRELSLPDDL